MRLRLRRVVIFTPNLAAMTAFYRDVLGLEIAGQEKGWVDFTAGDCAIALHAGAAKVGRRLPKIVFQTDDVAGARQALLARGLTEAGEVLSTAAFQMCDFQDPDGNRLQVSSRA
jgi:catechol 2,3-dioxygenase-like lactoylglutathione lyase family enzyme